MRDLPGTGGLASVHGARGGRARGFMECVPSHRTIPRRRGGVDGGGDAIAAARAEAVVVERLARATLAVRLLHGDRELPILRLCRVA